MGKFLRVTAIILMGLTGAHTLLGAAGSVSISWWPDKYESLMVVAPYKAVFQTATIFTFIAAVIGIRGFFVAWRSPQPGYLAKLPDW